MTRRMNRGEIERLAKVSGECPLCQSDTPKGGAVSTRIESGETVSIFLPECWLDRIQVGFPRANWW
jgi:hypothetical protein